MDNHHANFSPSQISCGVLQLYGITSDPERVLYALANYLYHPSRGTPAAFVIWSDTKDSNGVKFNSYLASELQNFAPTSQWIENPKTSNEITVWLWAIPHEKLKEWYKQKRIEKASKV